MAFEQWRLLSCHWGANGIRTHATEDIIGGTSLNYEQNTSDLCWSNSNINQNKLKKKKVTRNIVLHSTILIWGISSYWSLCATWLYRYLSIVQLMPNGKKIYIFIIHISGAILHFIFKIPVYRFWFYFPNNFFINHNISLHISESWKKWLIFFCEWYCSCTYQCTNIYCLISFYFLKVCDK